MEFPRALYLALSDAPLLSVRSPMSVHPSGNPWSLSHSRGVILLTIGGSLYCLANNVPPLPSWLEKKPMSMNQTPSSPPGLS